jgi:hypothetical protein
MNARQIGGQCRSVQMDCSLAVASCWSYPRIQGVSLRRWDVFSQTRHGLRQNVFLRAGGAHIRGHSHRLPPSYNMGG